MISESKNIRFGVVLTYISLGISLLGTVFISNRVLNLIGDHYFGLYSFVNSIATWLTVVSSALIASYLRYASLEANENNGETSRTNTIYLKLLAIMGLSILIVGLSIIFSLFFLNVCFPNYDWDDSKIIYVLFVFSIINISITLPATIFTQFINYKKQFIFEKSLLILTNISTFAFQFIIAFLTHNIVLISVLTLCLTLLNLVFNFIYCKRHLSIAFKKTRLRENGPLIKSISAFSGILLLNTIVDQISVNADKTLLGFFSTPENVTIYHMGMQFNNYLSFLCVAVSSVFAPRIHDFCVKNDLESVDGLFLRVSRLQGIVVCAITFGFIACGYDFVIWWIGTSRINAYYCGVILMVLSIMPFSVKLSIEIQRALNKHKFRSYLYFALAILNIGLSIILLLIIPSDYSIFACLIGTAVSTIICQWIAMNIYNKKVIKLSMEKHWIQLIKQICFGVISATASITINFFLFKNFESHLLKFMLSGLVFVLVYLAFLMLFDRHFIYSFLPKKTNN